MRGRPSKNADKSNQISRVVGQHASDPFPPKLWPATAWVTACCNTLRSRYCHQDEDKAREPNVVLGAGRALIAMPKVPEGWRKGAQSSVEMLKLVRV